MEKKFIVTIISLILFIGFKVIDPFFNGKSLVWEWLLFIPEYWFTLYALALIIVNIQTKNKIGIYLSGILLIVTLFYLPITTGNSIQNGEIKIVSHNKGFWQELDQNFFDLIKDQDIVLVQEMVEQDKTKLNESWNYEVSGDVLTVSKYPIVETQKHPKFLKTTINVNDILIDVYNVHLEMPLLFPGAFERRNKDYEDLYISIDQSDRCKIIAGDFNTKSNSVFIQKLMKGYNDAAQSKLDYPITWNDAFPLFRVDYIFSSKELVPSDYNAVPRITSDHYFIQTKLSGIEKCK